MKSCTMLIKNGCSDWFVYYSCFLPVTKTSTVTFGKTSSITKMREAARVTRRVTTCRCWGWCQVVNLFVTKMSLRLTVYVANKISTTAKTRDVGTWHFFFVLPPSTDGTPALHATTADHPKLGKMATEAAPDIQTFLQTNKVRRGTESLYFYVKYGQTAVKIKISWIRNTGLEFSVLLVKTFPSEFPSEEPDFQQ